MSAALIQKFGNPLRLRPALDLGLKVIMAHVAGLGQCKDLENNNEETTCFNLFWRLFNKKKYVKNLFADISGITIHTRVGHPTETLLKHPELHHRLVNGSDYPLPAINILYRTKQLYKLGYITKEEREALNEVYDFNPFLFDFVLKRTLKHPATGEMFKTSAFMIPKSFGCR